MPWYREQPEAAEQLLAVDILALGDYLSSLNDCYDAGGLRDQFPAVLDRFEGLVDDRRWAQQILLQRVYWELRPDWDREKGKLLLEGLDPDEVTDPEILTVFLDIHGPELSTAATLELCDRIINLSGDASYQLHYSVLKGILWIFLGEEETGIEVIEAAIEETKDAELETGWGQESRIGALHIVGVHRRDKDILVEARNQCMSALESDGWTDSGRARLHQILGDIAVSLGEHEQAREEYQRSLLLDARPVPVAIALARCHVTLGDSENATRLFDEIAARNLDDGEQVDLVLARAGLVLLPHQERLRREVRRDLEALNPAYPIHREARDRLLVRVVELDVQDSRLVARLKQVWESIGTYLILQPNFFGIGVDLKAIGDKLLGVPPSEVTSLPGDDESE